MKKKEDKEDDEGEETELEKRKIMAVLNTPI